MDKNFGFFEGLMGSGLCEMISNRQVTFFSCTGRRKMFGRESRGRVSWFAIKLFSTNVNIL